MLEPGATIGILGGGQLGRMLSVAASRLGFVTSVFEPGAHCPASHVANEHFHHDYDDQDALRRFEANCDVITYEFENIPTTALDLLGDKVRPNRRALEVSQDRLTEKNFLNDLGLKTAPYVRIDDHLESSVATIGVPSILKTRRFGYDGKGQIRLSSINDGERALTELAAVPCILEGFVDFDYEVSVIGARSLEGRVACFDPGENVHKGGILRTTTVPSRLEPERVDKAIQLTGKILNALDYVGVMGVELFVTADELIVNEIAPRVHNSGHWTQNGCVVDQFEQHIRAITGLPIGNGTRHADVIMENLIGDDMNRLPELVADPGAALHLYGKVDVKAGRKMGHVNRVIPT